MCGIAGIYSSVRDDKDRGYVQKMCDIMAHRGPDSSGVYVDETVALGHRRLKIIDLSDRGKQPMCNADQTLWITFNGEIYNYQELRADLVKKGYRFKSTSDTEVLLYLYQEEQEACLHKLRGMFAFAIWDTARKRLFCVRDRLGIKPLHYFRNKEKFIFASEIKAILEYPGVPRVLNARALKDYLYFKYPIGTDTFFTDIFTLEPGHYLILENGQVRIEQYWDLQFDGQNQEGLAELVEHLYAVLEDSVKFHMVSDVPLGTFLSGGIDTSCISTICSKHYHSQLKTFCCGSSAERENSDLAYAAKVAQSLGTDHHEIILQPRDFGDFMQQAIWHLDEPGGGTTAIPGYYVAKLARQNVTILLSGEGADEIFGGYEFYIKYFIETNFLRFRTFPQMQLFKYLPAYLTMVQSRELFLRSLWRSLQPKPQDYIEIRPNLNPAKFFPVIAQECLEPVSAYDPFAHLAQKYFRQPGKHTFVDNIQYLDVKTYLSRILHIYDRMCMAVSLENRVPMLDHKLVEFGAQIPLQHRFHKLLPKYPLRMSLKGKLADEIVTRKKAGFTLPIGEWFRHELKDQVQDILFSKTARERGLYNHQEIQRLWERHLQAENHLEYHTERLWSLLSLELWHRNFIDQPPAHGE